MRGWSAGCPMRPGMHFCRGVVLVQPPYTPPALDQGQGGAGEGAILNRDHFWTTLQVIGIDALLPPIDFLDQSGPFLDHSSRRPPL